MVCAILRYSATAKSAMVALLQPCCDRHGANMAATPCARDSGYSAVNSLGYLSLTLTFAMH